MESLGTGVAALPAVATPSGASGETGDLYADAQALLEHSQRRTDTLGAAPSLSDASTQVGGALATGADGLDDFTRKEMQLERRRDELVARLTDPTADYASITQELQVNDELRRKLRLEREKLEELKKLVFMLMLGLPLDPNNVKRLNELGLGELVQLVIKMSVGTGVNASKDVVRSILALRDMGINVPLSVNHEDQTQEGQALLREDLLSLEEQAATIAVLAGQLLAPDQRGPSGQRSATIDGAVRSANPSPAPGSAAREGSATPM